MPARERRRAIAMGHTNVYADLSYRTPESILVKAQIVSRIAELLTQKSLTQATAATFP
jgi:predicted XRE-type DNA-binding protein